MRITVLGATGWLGGSIMREALSRGHMLTATARSAERLAELELPQVSRQRFTAGY